MSDSLVHNIQYIRVIGRSPTALAVTRVFTDIPVLTKFHHVAVYILLVHVIDPLLAINSRPF